MGGIHKPLGWQYPMWFNRRRRYFYWRASLRGRYPTDIVGYICFTNRFKCNQHWLAKTTTIQGTRKSFKNPRPERAKGHLPLSHCSTFHLEDFYQGARQVLSRDRSSAHGWKSVLITRPAIDFEFDEWAFRCRRRRLQLGLWLGLTC